MLRILSILLILIQPLSLAAQEAKEGAKPPALFPNGYRGHEQLSSALRKLADERPALVTITSLGRSVEGRELWLVRIGRPEPDKQPHRPAVLIVANLEADHVVGSEVAARLVEKLAKGDDDDAEIRGVLDRWTIYIVPRLNADGVERMLAAGGHAETRVNQRLIDRDRDGRNGEDGPDDVDGDGLVLTMRVKDAKATHIADEKDTRLMKPAEIAKSQTPVYSVYREGTDDDGDGLIDEDEHGGVNLNRNWPHKWPEFDPEAGYSPGAEPETRALIRFIADHPEIAALVVYGLYDTISSEPKKPGSTLDDADLPFFVELSRNYATRIKDAAKAEPQAVAEAARVEPAKMPEASAARNSQPTPAGSASTALLSLESGGDGSLVEWAYQQRGIFALGARLWSLPELPEPGEGKPKLPTEPEARWLLWNDGSAGGQAFAPFKEFSHPTLGTVEIGGWKPGVRVNPPAERLGPLADSQLIFLKDITSRLPRIELADVEVKPKGDRLFEVRVRVVNEGTLPTALAAGLKSKSSLPLVVRMKCDGARILSGRPLTKIDTLRGLGGSQELRWLVEAAEDSGSVEVEAGSPVSGHVRQTIKLQ